MDECELLTFVTAIACAIAKNCPEDEIIILSSIFTQLGDSLATVLAKRSLADNGNGKDSDDNSNVGVL